MRGKGENPQIIMTMTREEDGEGKESFSFLSLDGNNNNGEGRGRVGEWKRRESLKWIHRLKLQAR